MSSAAHHVPSIYQSYGKVIALDPEHFSQGALSWIPIKDLGLFEDVATQAAAKATLAHFLLEERRQEFLAESQG